ncbi:hypothetical protein DL95DRAFT_465518 [Leptodontidium sp. 2 PMI_412]|nr:hypothetical protein DL95DRAFT_465518 [Leptodontidium sp. 2 PMI_412]
MSANRPTRSRIASPFPPTTTIESADSATEGRDGESMPRSTWVEPSLAAPRPSYAEAGHERHGVVLNMMPLGVGPSAKVLKALATVEKPKKSISSVSTPEVATPEPPQIAEIAEMPEVTEVAETIETPRQQSVPAQTIEVEEDEALPKTPRSPGSARKSVSRPSVGPPSAGQSVFALQRSPTAALATDAALEPPRYPRYTSDSATPEPALGPDGLPIINMDFTDRVVEYAVNEALDRHKWPTAYALRTFYDEGRTNPRMVRLFDSIYNGWADVEQMTEFRSTMRIKKKEGKKGKTGEYYFNGDDPAPARPIFNAMNIIHAPVSTYQSVYQTPYTSFPASQPSSVRDSSQPRASSVVHGSMTVSASPQPDHEHISKKQRSNSFQPVNGTVINGNASMNGTTKSQSPAVLGSSRVQSPAAQPSPAAETNGDSRASPGDGKRSRSNSSTSSLSSVNEDLIEDTSIISPLRPAPAPAPALVRAPISTVPSHLAAKYGPVLGLGFGPTQQTPRFVSPYASAEGFQAVALSAEAARHARPISQPAKAGPRTFTFSTNPAAASASASAQTPPAASLAGPSSASNQPSSASTSTPALNTTTTEPPSKSSMAPTVLVHSSSNSSTTSTKKYPPTFRIKNTSKAQQAQLQVSQEEVDASNRLKRKAREITGKTPTAESNERHEVKAVKAAAAAAAEERGNQSDGGDSIAVKPNKKQKKLPKVRLLNRNRETRQNSRYASDEGSSPTELAFKPPFPPGDSLPSSRAGTPTAANRPTRKQKTGSGLRVKTSPMKKKTGTSAGIPKDMRSPISNGGPMTQDGENDDYCSACGGNGDLVCCDGCTRSFHFKCVDPPIIEGSQPLPDDWYCNSCQLKQNGPFDDDTGGVWGPLISEFEDKNPRSFRLPEPIREYFVDVKTGADGEYEEIIPPKPKNNKAGWEEAPDYFRKKDAKGKIILCHRCNGEASAPNRMIIPCSFCGLYWHLDCLDVPLAKEPGAGRQWRCPAHVDDLLAILPATLAPAHRFRKIKGASVIKPAVTRGLKNNGHIEIENDPSEDEEEQGFYELREFGHVYKLPEISIKLDFISRVKQMRGKYVPSLYSSKPRPEPVAKTTAVPPAPSVPAVPGTNKPWTQRTMEEQQAALNLASLVANSNDPALGDNTGLLINTLLAEAPPAVVSLVAQSTAENITAAKLTKKEKQGIQAFFNFLKEKLDNADSSSDEDDSAPATPPASTEEQSVIPEVTTVVDNSKFATVESVDEEDTEMLL